ncbi:hypothetical protein GL263_19470 [Streptomyces durbertensis]|uniref:HNH endonuclease n=1 Tax=Streptomyces durbertensis TaxID=2448886 RepID=A0ABR6EK56_9ACTN|nr:hypothetical protein [Streptomyces durbertensis]MBB1245722.1 hypothetical protein [Streptomyces durbertensis]
MAEKLRRNYSNATIAALMTLARGGCYAPRCGAPTVRFIDGEPVLSLEIAHIRALKPDGKRFDPTWTVEARNSFANLILLCNVHHKRVDGAGGEKYTVEILLAWKREREADGGHALAGLSGLTETRLAEMICEAQEAYVDRLAPLLGEIAKQMPQLASLIKVLKDDLERASGRLPGVSEDVALMMYQASNGLSHLQDSAPWLAEAGNDLMHLQDNAPLLAEAAAGLSRLVDLPSALNDAAAEIRGAAAALADARYYQ